MISSKVLGIVDRFETKGKPALVKHFQNVFAVIDSLIICKFTFFAI